MGPPGGLLKVGRHAGSQDLSHSQPRLDCGRGILVPCLDSTGVKGQLFQSWLWAPVNRGRLLLLAQYMRNPSRGVQWLAGTS